jgi:DnaJ-class molecular chaperone
MRTHSVICRDSRGTILHRWTGVPVEGSGKVLAEQRAHYPALTVTRHLDVQQECHDCDGTGLWNVIKRFGCPKCGGEGRIITDQIGSEV